MAGAHRGISASLGHRSFAGWRLYQDLWLPAVPRIRIRWRFGIQRHYHHPAANAAPFFRHCGGDSLMATTESATSTAPMTRAQRAALPLSAEVAQVLAEQHGVCVRPLAMRRIDTTTGRVDVVPVPCGSTREDQCRPCADKARRLRMAQCREGWHLDTEPVTERATPSAEQQELMSARADLLLAYAQCREGWHLDTEPVTE